MRTEQDFIDFFSHYRPDAVPTVPGLLLNKDPDALWAELLKEYGPWPVDTDDQETIKALDSAVGKAVIIGIDYVGFGGGSMGSVDSAKVLQKGLIREGFKGEIKMLVDDGNIDTIPSKKNILAALEWLANGSRPGQVCFLAFIGKTSHGGHKETEGSGCLYPADHRAEGPIRGADIIKDLSTNLSKGAELFVVCDSRPIGYNIAVLQHQLVSFFEGDVHPRVATRCTVLGSAPRITVLSVHKPRLNLETTVYDLSGTFVKALGQLRRPFEDYQSLAEARKGFVGSYEKRFGVKGMWDKVTSLKMQSYCGVELTELQEIFKKMGGDVKKTGIVQNMLREHFNDVTLPPFSHLTAPPLSSLIHAVRDIMQSSSIAPMLTSNTAFPMLLPKPFVTHPTGWQAFGVFPDHSAPPIHTYSWTPRIGYISSGGDILGSPLRMTLNAALILAGNTKECKGFCFKQDGQAPVDPENDVLLVYFKDRYNIQGRGWVTYAPQGVKGGDVWAPPVVEGDVRSVIAEMIWKNRPGGSTVQELERYKSDRVEKIVKKDVRQRLVNFYQFYNPNKLPSVVPTLLEFVDMEDLLFDALHKRYGPDPPDIMSLPLPENWALAESPSGDLFYKNLVTGQKQWERPQHPARRQPHADRTEEFPIDKSSL